MLNMQRSVVSFIIIIAFGTGAAIFVVKKGNDAADELERLNSGVFAVHRVALADESDNGVLDTSNLKTYRNEKYGFEVRYPPKWTLEVVDGYDPSGRGIKGSENDFLFTDSALHRMMVMPNGYPSFLYPKTATIKKRYDLDGMIGQMQEFRDVLGMYAITIDQFSYTKYPAFEIVFIPINAREYIDSAKLADLDAVLSTFKFIK